MSEAADSTVHAIPARVADLAFRISLPRDWKTVDLPEEEVDFESPAAFFPLLLAAAPWAAVALTVAARPGFEDGTLQDWSLFLLDSQGIRPTAFGPATIGNLQGLAGVGRQQQEETWLEVRFAFLEDGGRLVYLGLLAPEAISAALETMWKTALASFELERPRGQNVPLGPRGGIEAPAAEEPPATEQIAATEHIEEPAPAPAPPQFTEEEFAHYAKSDDANTLDPDHPVNARLRDQGVGFPPNILELDLAGRSATVGAGGISAAIRVALGWHVIDDGRRTLVLDPGGKIQISLNVIRKDGRSVDQILDQIQTEAEQSYQNPEFLRLENDGIRALALRNIVVNGEPVEQVHMLTRWADDSAVLRARVTADPQSMRFAANYADLILKSAYYGQPAEEPEPPFADGPAWMQVAGQLEREDRLEEAERLIRDKIPTLHFAITTAELYRRRWVRLRESDPDKGAEARKHAAKWAYAYASYATSGGEGAALSAERDEFLRQLGPEPLE